MLEVRDVSKSFDGFQAVGGVSFTVPKGSISAIIGPNGAGKTPRLKMPKRPPASPANAPAITKAASS